MDLRLEKMREEMHASYVVLQSRPATTYDNQELDAPGARDKVGSDFIRQVRQGVTTVLSYIWMYSTFG
jgi:hypothetical protein